jgi:hypothetical protein
MSCSPRLDGLHLGNKIASYIDMETGHEQQFATICAKRRPESRHGMLFGEESWRGFRSETEADASEVQGGFAENL